MLLPTFFGNLLDLINQWDFHILLFLALGGIFLFTCYALIFFTTNANSKLPPGPPGLPIIGNLLSLDPELHKYFTTLSQTYGPIFLLRFGAKHGAVVSSPSMAREVLKDKDVIFANHDVPLAGRVLTYGGCDVPFSPYGSQWKMLRKAFVQWVSNSTTMDSVCKLRHKELQKTVGYIYSQLGSPVDIGDLMFLTVLNMNKKAIFGGTEEEDEFTSIGGEFREVVEHIMELLGKPNLSDLFPWLDLQGVERQMRLVVQKFDHIFEKMIEQRFKKKAISGRNVEENQDFLEFLFKLKDELKDSETPLTMANIKSLFVTKARQRCQRRLFVITVQLQKLKGRRGAWVRHAVTWLLSTVWMKMSKFRKRK